MIVGCHFATHGGFQFNSQMVTIPRLWWNFLELGGNFGVDVFVLISGYFLIGSNKLHIKPIKIIKLWGQIVFYSIALFVVSICLNRDSFSVRGIINGIFPITFDQWWFASTYFVMYLIHPYLNRMLHSISKKEYQKLLIMLLGIWSIIPTITGTTFQSNKLIEFLFYYSIAGYIKLHGFQKKRTCKQWFLLWSIFSILTYLFSVVVMVIGTKNDLFLSYSLFFYSRNSILTIFRAISFFMLFLNMKVKTSKVINRISACAFGVYLLHDSSLLRGILWNNVFHNASFQNTIFIIPYSIVVVVIVYLGCTLIDFIRITYIEKAFLIFVDRYIEPIICKLETIVNKISIKVFD